MPVTLKLGLFTVHLLDCACPGALGRRAPVLKADDRSLAGNDDRQIRDRHPYAVEHQSLRSMGTGPTPEGMALNSAYRRRVGANVHQAHLGAARQTLHSRPGTPFP